jgi:hypothetical protein
MKNFLIIAVWILFMAAFAATLFLRRRFTVVLMENHSQAYARLGAPPPQLFPFSSAENLAAIKAQNRYMRSEEYRELNDADLDRLAKHLRSLFAAQMILGVFFIGFAGVEIAGN